MERDGVPSDPDRVVLTRRQDQLVRALDALDLGFLYSDWARLLYASEGLARMIGRPAEELLAMPDPYELFTLEDRDKIRALALARVTGRDTPDSVTGRIVGPGGRLIQVEFIIQTIQDGSGRPHVASFAVALDDAGGVDHISELRGLIRALGDASRDPLLVTTQEGGTIFRNEAATGLLRQLGRAAASTLPELLAACDLAEPEVLLEAARARGAASGEGAVLAVPFSVRVFATPDAFVIWWRPSGARLLAPAPGGR